MPPQETTQSRETHGCWDLHIANLKLPSFCPCLTEKSPLLPFQGPRTLTGGGGSSECNLAVSMLEVKGPQKIPPASLWPFRAIPSGNLVGDSVPGLEWKLHRAVETEAQRQRSLTVSGTGRLSPGPGRAQPEIVAGSARAPPASTAATAENPLAEAKAWSIPELGRVLASRERRGHFAVPNSLEKVWQSWPSVARVCVRWGATSSARCRAIVLRRSLIGCVAGSPEPLSRVTLSAPT